MEAIAIKADLSDLSQIDVMFDAFMEKFGHLDVIINNSAIAEKVIEKSFKKVNNENVVRDAILSGMSATEVYEKYHIL